MEKITHSEKEARGRLQSLAREKRSSLAALSPTVDRVLRLTRMDSVFTIHPSTASALGRSEAC